MARLRNAWYGLHTKNQTIWTADKSIVERALNTGRVPVYRLHKDGYLRAETRKLTFVDCLYYATAPVTAKSLA